MYDSTKRCTQCDEEYPSTREYFHVARFGRNGLSAKCKKCRSTRKTPLPEPVPEGHKRCTGCKQVLSIIHFSQEKRNNDGLRSACKDCLNKQAKHYREEHGEEIAQRAAQDYQRHKEKRQARHKQYACDHKETLCLMYARYQREHKEKISEYQSQWRQTERGKSLRRAAHRRRRARKRNAVGSFTAQQFQEQIRRQKHKCYYCGKRQSQTESVWHPDHVIPLSRGGSNSIDNIVAACPVCNLKKHNKLPHEWAEGGRLL